MSTGAIPLAILILQQLPSLILGLQRLVQVIRSHPDTSDEAKAMLRQIALDLEETARKVAAVEV